VKKPRMGSIEFASVSRIVGREKVRRDVKRLERHPEIYASRMRDPRAKTVLAAAVKELGEPPKGLWETDAAAWKALSGPAKKRRHTEWREAMLRYDLDHRVTLRDARRRAVSPRLADMKAALLDPTAPLYEEPDVESPVEVTPAVVEPAPFDPPKE
jgi:hypothetical protein